MPSLNARQQIVAYPHQHRYELIRDGLKPLVNIASITGVISFFDSEQKKAAIEATRHEWEARGNACHLAAHKYWQHQKGVLSNGSTWAPEMGEFSAWIEPMLNHRLFRECKVIASEFSIFDEEYQISGTLDMLLWDPEKEKIILCDLKTQKNWNSRAYDTSKQLGGYVWLLERNYQFEVDECMTLYARPTVCTGKRSKLNICKANWKTALELYLEEQPSW